MKSVLGGIAAIAGVIALMLGLYFIGVYVFGGAQRSTADYRGETDAIEKLKADGNYRIQVYEHYFDLCSAVKTDETRLDNAEKELARTTDPARTMQLSANITAISNSRAEKINHYNADSQKDFTQAAFKDLDLPFQLDINDKETQCAS